ncbi:maltokinase N-terminal cap-like domain-containing protein [Microbacterium sp. RD1]|uniref:maltokinase N-terminal cap-like domain-containing protein n=1 Tax=Microbacterium sp. RD1 TaxID=3457313 RepID=UPI003FA5DBB5
MDSTLPHLQEWMPRQRWFAGKGTQPVLRAVAEWEVGRAPRARAVVLLVADSGGTDTVVYQVPVVWHEGAVSGAIASVDGRSLTDGTADPYFQALLYSQLTAGGAVAGEDGPLAAEPAAAHTWPAEAPAAVLEGEQSNTSIIYRPHGTAPLICKVFRQVHPGVNPDIEIQAALGDAGLRTVPPLIGTVSGVWRDPRHPGIVSGSLAFAQEFFPGVEDAWRVALRSAENGVDFHDQAVELGSAVAGMHAALARLFPTRSATDDDRARVAAGWRSRWDAARQAVPDLDAVAGGVTAVFDHALETPWPLLQRVHGDLHLGQVLEVPGRGWVLLDFEGEPLRPMDERREPDFAIRDVAGMLRSFAYAADSVPSAPAEDRRAWEAAARRGFLEGYAASAAATPLDPVLVRAFELDKALYETVYEARNRPGWLPIPLGAVRRMTAS